MTAYVVGESAQAQDGVAPSESCRLHSQATYAVVKSAVTQGPTSLIAVTWPAKDSAPLLLCADIKALLQATHGPAVVTQAG